MSTKCNVVIEWGRSKVYLFRNYDGQPADAGADIVRKLHAGGEFDRMDQFLRVLLEEEMETVAGHQQYVYSLADGLEGGIEWAYFIRGDEDQRKVSVAVVELPVELTQAQEEKRIENRFYQPLQEFARYVNTQIIAQNERLAQMQAEHPTNAMLAAAGPDELLGPGFTGDDMRDDEETTRARGR